MIPFSGVLARNIQAVFDDAHLSKVTVIFSDLQYPTLLRFLTVRFGNGEDRSYVARAGAGRGVQRWRVPLAPRRRERRARAVRWENRPRGAQLWLRVCNGRGRPQGDFISAGCSTGSLICSCCVKRNTQRRGTEGAALI